MASTTTDGAVVTPVLDHPTPAPRREHLTPAEREARGKAARAGTTRESHATFQSDGRDPVTLLEGDSLGRLPELVPIRYGRMLASEFAFYRGGAALMAHDLGSAPRTTLYAQLSGDAHLANFGGFASPDRALVLDINDFDETLPGPFEWDLKRLATSFEVAGRHRGFRSKVRNDAVRTAVRSYREAMRAFAAMGHLDVWYSRLEAAQVEAQLAGKQAKRFRRTVAKAHGKGNLRAFAKLTRQVDGETRIVSDPPLIVPIDDIVSDDAARQEMVASVRALLDVYRETLPPDRRRLFDGYRYVDLARKVVGVGSVGTRCWIVLLLGRDEQDPLFLQVKEAGPSPLERALGPSDADNHGRRIVEGQRLMQAAGDIFLGWLRATGLDGELRDFYVRQLWDWKASADLDTLPAAMLAPYAGVCGQTLARAHARSGDRIAIAAYVGKGDALDRALAEFAVSYADQNARDYAALRDAATSGRIAAAEGM